MRTLGIWLVIVFVVVGMGIARPAPAGPAAPRRGGELVVALSRDLRSTNPLVGGTIDAVDYNMAIAELPVLYGKDGLDPWLLEDYTAGTDGTYTWKVRRNIKFTDGTPLNAEAIKVSIEHLLEPRNEYPYRVYFLGKTQSIDVVDEYTLRIKNRTFDVEFMDRMPNVGVISPTALRRGVDFRRAPVGSGPFKLASYTPGERIVLERNDQYWRPNEPYLDRIVFRIIPDENVRLLELEAGGVHYAVDMGAADLRRATSRGLRVQQTAAAGSMLVYFNLRKITDTAVRRAVSHAIDRDAIVKALYQQYGSPAHYNIPKAMAFYHDESVPGTDYDLDRAKAILDEAGWKVGPDGIRANARGEKLNWTMPISSIASQIAGSQMIAGMLKRVGIQANIQIMDFRTYEARAINGDYDVVYWEWAGSSTDNPWHNTTVTYSKYAWKIPQINDPLLDRLHEQSLVTLDRAARKQILKQYFTHVQRNHFYYTIGHKPYMFLSRPEVQGVHLGGNRTLFNAAYLAR